MRNRSIPVAGESNRGRPLGPVLLLGCCLILAASCAGLGSSAAAPERGALTVAAVSSGEPIPKGRLFVEANGAPAPGYRVARNKDGSVEASGLPSGWFRIGYEDSGEVGYLCEWQEVWPGWETGALWDSREAPGGESLELAKAVSIRLDPRTIPDATVQTANPRFLSDSEAVLASNAPGPVMVSGDLAGGWNYPAAPFCRRLGGTQWLYPFGLPSGGIAEYLLGTASGYGPDPLNPRAKTVEDLGKGNGLVEMPGCKTLEWELADPAVPAAKVERFELSGPNPEFRRAVTVILPPDYASSTASYPTLYLHDGNMHRIYGIEHEFEHFWAAGLAPKMVVVLVDNAGPFRAAEFLPPDQVPSSWYPKSLVEGAIKAGSVPAWYRSLSAEYLAFWEKSLIPEIERRYRTGGSAERRAVIGESNGSIITFIMLQRLPGLFGLAACESGYVETLDLDRLGSAGKLRLWASVGSLERDSLACEDIFSSLRSQLRGAPSVELRTGRYPGGHNPMAWAAEFPAIFAFWWPKAE